MKNEYMPNGNELSLPVPDGTLSGAPVLIGSLTGVAATDKGAGGNTAANATVLLGQRVYLLNVNGAITGVGQPIYIVAADNTLTTTAGSNVLFGHSVSAADGKYATKATGVGPALVRKV